ncbi:MAG: glycosyltransferase [Candidatus Helarchaeota archaeon]
MRILIIPELDWISSLQNRVQKIFTRMSKSHEIHIIYFEHEKRGINKSYRLKNNLYLHKPPTLFIKNKFLFYLINSIPIYNYINKIIKKYDIKIIVSTNFLFSPLCIISTKINRIPFVFDLVDFQPFHIYYLSFLPKIIKKIGCSFLSKVLDFDIKHADHIITTGIPLLRYANRINSKHSIISNGVDTNLFNSSIGGLRIKKKYNLTGLTISFIGALEYWIDYDYIFKTLSLLKKEYSNVKLLMVGPTRHFGLNRILNIAKKHNVISNIIITKTIPYNQLASYIKASDVCILPFIKNYLTHCSVPMKIYEYLACECPVISVNLAAVSSTFKDSIFYADTPKKFVIVIHDILNNNKKVENKIDKGKLLINRNNWDSLTNKFEDILKKIIANF